MSDRALIALAREAGLAVDWVDATGRKQSVSPDTLRAVLSALGFSASSSAAIRDSRQRLELEKRAPPRTIVTTVGKSIEVPAKSRHAELTPEQGPATSVVFRNLCDGVATFQAPWTAGYHRLEVDGREHVLAIAPEKAFQPTLRERAWGAAAQLYALRGGKTKGYGDLGALAQLGKKLGRLGADAIAISPIHAPLPGIVDRYSPYSPSSRFVLNPLFAAVPSGADSLDTKALIAWHAASEAKLKALDHAYAKFLGHPRMRDAFESFVRAGGSRLLSHGRFEALHARFVSTGRADWRNWPVQYRNASSADATRLGRGDRELECHLFRQWLADRHLAQAQKSARNAGMAIGVISDLAVGMDPRGSHAWSASRELLVDLSIGAPPDALGPEGQDWGLTTLSPFAARADGYESYIATLRASMRHTGGIRVDHAMGLMRLWVIPGGAPSKNGVYLSYPFEDLLRLLVLESVRNRTVVIAEDLGTVPSGFREHIARAGLLGMRVLLFERDRRGSFTTPSQWDKDACALSTTHDLATLAGWWRGRDLAWRARVSNDFDINSAQHSRQKDRRQLWQSLRRSHCAEGPRPATNEEQLVVDSATTFVARTASRLAIVPLEDIVGEVEQPNLPGTVDEHPNWRRRLPLRNGLGTSRARRRLEGMARERPRL